MIILQDGMDVAAAALNVIKGSLQSRPESGMALTGLDRITHESGRVFYDSEREEDHHLYVPSAGAYGGPGPWN